MRHATVHVVFASVAGLTLNLAWLLVLRDEYITTSLDGRIALVHLSYTDCASLGLSKVFFQLAFAVHLKLLLSDGTSHNLIKGSVISETAGVAHFLSPKTLMTVAKANIRLLQ